MRILKKAIRQDTQNQKNHGPIKEHCVYQETVL